MADKPLSFTLQLFDKLSQPAGGMAKALDDVVRRLDESVVAAAQAGGGLGDLGDVAKRQAEIHKRALAAMNQRSQKAFRAMVDDNIDKALGKQHPMVKVNADLSALKTTIAGAGVDWATLGKAALAGGTLAGAFSFGVLPAAQAVVGVIGSIADKIWSATKAVGTFYADLWRGAIKRERSNLSLDLLLGAEEAAHLNRYINDTAKHTAFLRGELKGAAKQLVVAGFAVNDLPKALSAAQDVAAISGKGLEEAAGVLERVKLSGKFEGETLRPLGVSSESAIGNLASILKVSPKAAREAMSQNKVKADQVLAALYMSLQQKTKGPLGTAAVKAGGTVDALLYKISHLPETYFAALSGSVGNSKSFAGFRDALQKINDILDPSSALGQKFIDKVGKLITWLTDFLLGDALSDGPGKISGLERVFLSLSDSLDTVAGFIMGAAKAFASLYSAAKPVMGMMAQVGGFMVNPLAGAGGGDNYEQKKQAVLDRLWQEKAKAKQRLLGGQVAAGFAQGMTISDPLVADSGARMANSADAAVRKAAGIQSPSRVFSQLGGQVAAGFAQGITAGGSMVGSAVEDMAAAPSVRAGRSTISSIDVGGIHIQIDGAGQNAQQVGEVVSARLRSEFPSILCQLLEVLQTEAGTSTATG